MAVEPAHWRIDPMTTSFDHLLDQRFRGRPVEELLSQSPSIFKGVSPAAAQALQTALRIRSVRDLAVSRVFLQAQALLAASGQPGFDPGPPLPWAEFFAAAPIDHYVQHSSQRFRLDFGPVYYRGRLDGSARVIVVGQDPSTNEILAQRILVGSSGQRVQGFLRKLGLTRSYTMLNAFLFSVFGQFDTALRAISLESPVRDFRNAWLDRLIKHNRIEAIVAVGNAARHALEQWPGSATVPVVTIMHPAALDPAALLQSWNAGVATLQPIVTPDEDGARDTTPYVGQFTPEDESPIPAHDLPFGLPAWHGQGAHSSRDGNKTIIWTAP
jgi:uracil-DNA glycosylase